MDRKRNLWGVDVVGVEPTLRSFRSKTNLSAVLGMEKFVFKLELGKSRLGPWDCVVPSVSNKPTTQ